MNIMRYVLVCIVLCASVIGCSVKEDRQMCPCRLMLDMTGIDTVLVRKVNLLVVSDNGIVLADSVDYRDFSKLYVRDVPHGFLKVNVWGGDNTGRDLLIPYGCECPSFYMHAFEVDTRGEVCRESVQLKKNHCCLTVLMDGRKDLPYSLTVRGRVNGYQADGLPSRGDFSCVAYPADDSGVQVIIPRQTDSSLLLDVEDAESSVIRSFALGEYLINGGYDWNAENLEDATVILDYCITGIKIIYKGWDKEYTYDIIL